MTVTPGTLLLVTGKIMKKRTNAIGNQLGMNSPGFAEEGDA